MAGVGARVMFGVPLVGLGSGVNAQSALNIIYIMRNAVIAVVGFVSSSWQWLLDIADSSALPMLKFDLSSQKFSARFEPLQTISLLGRSMVEIPADK